MRGATRAKAVLGDGMVWFTSQREMPDKNSKHKQWEDWLQRLEETAKDLRSQMHGSERKKICMLQRHKNKRLKEWVEGNEQGKAFKSVLKLRRDGAVDTAHITQEDGRRRAALSGEEVKQHHLDTAQDWMGRRHRRWFNDGKGCLNGKEATKSQGLERQELWQEGAHGDCARQMLADGVLLDDEGMRARLPGCFHKLAECLQRVEVNACDDHAVRMERVASEGTRRVCETDYDESGLGEPITDEDWQAFWRGIKGHTRGGASGVSVDLIKACYKESREGTDTELGTTQRARGIGEAARLLVNVARVERKYYRSWQQELLYYFIKNPGTTGLENSRPVGLLEVMFKCSESFDSSAIMSVWTRLGLLQEEQWAFREGRGCEGPLMI